jgi:hypothetical protein
MLESTIEKHVTKYAKNLGWLSYKFSSPSNSGVPDRIYFREGRTLLIEFKQKGKQPRALQQFHINKLKEELIPVYVVDSINSGKEVFNAY